MLSENGTVLGKSSNIISYLKLYPYALFSASMVGAITRNFSTNFKWKYTGKNFENHLSLLWTLSTTQRASRVAFTIFAIEEAVAELLSNLRKCPKKKSYKKSPMVMTTEIEDSQIRAWSLWYDREIQFEIGCLRTPSTSSDFIIYYINMYFSVKIIWSIKWSRIIFTSLDMGTILLVWWIRWEFYTS